MKIYSKTGGVSGGDESSLSHPPRAAESAALARGCHDALIGHLARRAVSKTISMVPVLAVIVPLFSNTGGTVGIQALTVTIRSLGVGEVTPADTMKILLVGN
jgi:magnesium transporter